MPPQCSLNAPNSAVGISKNHIQDLDHEPWRTSTAVVVVVLYATMLGATLPRNACIEQTCHRPSGRSKTSWSLLAKRDKERCSLLPHIDMEWQGHKTSLYTCPAPVGARIGPSFLNNTFLQRLRCRLWLKLYKSPSKYLLFSRIS